MKTLGRFVRDVAAFGRRRLALVVGLVASAALFEVIGLVALIELVRSLGVDGGVDRGLGAAPSFTLILLTYVASVVARGSVERMHARVGQQIEAGFVSALRGRVYRALTFADWNFHARRRVADAIHALTSETDRVGAATYYLLQLIAGAAIAAVYVAAALWTSPFLTLVVVLCSVVLVVLLRRPARAAVSAGEAASVSTGRVYRAIAEHFAGMKTAKSYGALDRHVAAFDALSLDLASVGAQAVRASAAVRQRLELGSIGLLALLLWVAHERLQLPVGETIVLLFVFSRLMPRVKDLLTQGTSLLGLLPAFEALVRLEAEGHAAAEVKADAGGRTFGSGTDLGAPDTAAVTFEHAVRLEGVRFTYPDRADVAAVAAVDLTIAAGRTVAIVGPSGAGKSTMADLVMGLVRPERGRLTVDGREVDGARAAAWRRHIGYVAQDTFLFHDTVRANLLWAAPGAVETDLWRALDHAAATTFVRALPRGLDTIVGDRGVLLSGGERQRLSLARALLRAPNLLILDEATSALDAENEASVLSAVAALHGRLAILLITHRLSAVRGADLIHVMESGRIVEKGSWTSLIRPGTKFRHLCEVQGVDVAPR